MGSRTLGFLIEPFYESIFKSVVFVNTPVWAYNPKTILFYNFSFSLYKTFGYFCQVEYCIVALKIIYSAYLVPTPHLFLGTCPLYIQQCPEHPLVFSFISSPTFSNSQSFSHTHTQSHKNWMSFRHREKTKTTNK